MIRHSVLFTLFLILSVSSFSQTPDSLETKEFENFFGSDCPDDTITKTVGQYGEITLISRERKLHRVKNGKVKSTTDLSGFFENADYLCLIFHLPSKKKRKYIAVVLAYSENHREVGRAFIEIPSGKVLSTVYPKDQD